LRHNTAIVYGRLKGLAELRGVMQTVEAFRSGRVE
jgi:D-mannonate dehydratase